MNVAYHAIHAPTMPYTRLLRYTRIRLCLYYYAIHVFAYVCTTTPYTYSPVSVPYTYSPMPVSLPLRHTRICLHYATHAPWQIRRAWARPVPVIGWPLPLSASVPQFSHPPRSSWRALYDGSVALAMCVCVRVCMCVCCMSCVCEGREG